MTQIELLVARWDHLQHARLNEMQELAEKTDIRQRMSLVDALNADPYWEHIFDLLEKVIREVDPAHDYPLETTSKSTEQHNNQTQHQ